MSENNQQINLQDEMDDEIMDEFNDAEEQIQPETQAPQPENNNKKTRSEEQSHSTAAASAFLQELPELTRKDKTLKEVLDLMDDEFAPIIPDAVTDYYLAKNGFESSDVKIKRLLALATQKFILDIAQDAYEYSRIRSASAVYNSSNPQVRAKQLIQGQQYVNQQQITGANGSGVEGDQQQPLHTSTNAGNQQGKIVLTMEDLSSALSEYGLNPSRPDFYR